jgi:cobalt-zinc-cadmium efflux system outer membrane protein
MRTELAVATALLLAATGCAAVNPRAGLPDVERLVAARAPLPVAWPEDADGEARVAATVDAALATDLTVENAVRIALLNNHEVRALYAELGVAEAELVQAGLLPNPVLNANVRFGLGPSGTGTELGLVQDVMSALQIPLKRRVAAANRAIATRGVAAALVNLALDVKVAFARLQGAAQMLELRRRVLDTAAAARTVAERQHAAGSITDLDRATAAAQSEDAKLELALAESALAGDREDLNTLLGLWGDRTAWRIAPELPPLPRETIAEHGLETLAVSQRLDLEVARLRGESAVAQYRLGRFYGLFPAASLGTAAHREVDGTWSVGPAFDLPIPLFDQRQAELAATAARATAADERYAALAVRIRADVRRAHVRLAAARARAEHYQRVVLPLAATVVAETQREYNAMLVGVFGLLQAKRDEVETGRRAIEALTDYWVSRAELERAVGGMLPIADDTDAHHNGG